MVNHPYKINRSGNKHFFYVTGGLSLDLYFDCPIHYPLFCLVVIPISFTLLMFFYGLLLHFYFVPERFYSLLLFVNRVLCEFILDSILSKVIFKQICQINYLIEITEIIRKEGFFLPEIDRRIFCLTV